MQMVGEAGLQVTSTKGHSVEFQGMDTPIYIVANLVEACLAAGAIEAPSDAQEPDPPVAKRGRPAKAEKPQ